MNNSCQCIFEPHSPHSSDYICTDSNKLKVGNNIFHKIRIETVLFCEKSSNETVKDCLQNLLHYCYRTEGFIPNPLPLPDYAEIYADRKP